MLPTPALIALQFLTRLPVRLPGIPEPEQIGRSLLWYPLVGLLLGGLLLAAQALRATQRPIFDIAMDLGYVSQQTFSRVFRREFDRTPSDYRHQLN